VYTRVTQLEIDVLRADVGEVVRMFEERVVPDLKELPGYEGVLALATPEGKGIIVSFWETAEAADASAAFAAGALEEFVTLFSAPPGREHYEVVYGDLPATVT
jgi:heme-degrading monooxygenase HmoA